MARQRSTLDIGARTTFSESERIAVADVGRAHENDDFLDVEGDRRADAAGAGDNFQIVAVLAHDWRLKNADGLDAGGERMAWRASGQSSAGSLATSLSRSISSLDRLTSS